MPVALRPEPAVSALNYTIEAPPESCAPHDQAMSTVARTHQIDHASSLAEVTGERWQVWSTASLAGLSVAWPMLFAAMIHGPRIIMRSLSGDSYHYLAIARKAHLSGIYTYDGVHVTNGFHPLWQYTLRGLFALFRLETHEAQAIATVWLALIATTMGVVLASAAVVRMTRQRFLGLLLVPGLYYLAIGVHVRNLPIWEALDGMESAFSVLFCGVFFFTVSHFVGESTKHAALGIGAYRAIGFLLPFIILSRLDDVFLLPAFLGALLVFEPAWKSRIAASIWICAPSAAAIVCYLIYNHLTVGAAMPLSGGTKAGFAGFIDLYLTAAIHFPPILELKAYISQKPADGASIFSNSFRFVEVVYPLLASAFGALALWKFRKPEIESRTSSRVAHSVFFAVCLYIIFKMSYNFLNVHPWHQADWYYAFAILSLSVLGAVALQAPWRLLDTYPVARHGIVCVYVCLMLLSASQYYAAIVFQQPEALEQKFWDRHTEIRQQLVAHGVTGVINVDDGITAFMLDLPMMHGFAFATDVEAQHAHRTGHMLSLASSRGINTITGFEYLATDSPPHTQAEIEDYLSGGLAGPLVKSEIDQFDYTLAYYDPVLKMPFVSFTPRHR